MNTSPAIFLVTLSEFEIQILTTALGYMAKVKNEFIETVKNNKEPLDPITLNMLNDFEQDQKKMNELLTQFQDKDSSKFIRSNAR